MYITDAVKKNIQIWGADDSVIKGMKSHTQPVPPAPVPWHASPWQRQPQENHRAPKTWGRGGQRSACEHTEVSSRLEGLFREPRGKTQ